jgi:hypothetical protein
VTDRDDRLLDDLARRNWWVLSALLLASLGWRSPDVTLGVLGGGLAAVIGFFWLRRSLTRLLLGDGRNTPVGFQVGTLLRLTVLAGFLYLLVAVLQVHPLALTAGLSVVVINLFWTTALRLWA